MHGSIYSFITGTLALRYAEQETIHPIVFIWTDKWPNISVASSRVEHGKLNNIMSISEVGRDSPTAFEPNSIAWEVGKIDWIKHCILSNATRLYS